MEPRIFCKNCRAIIKPPPELTIVTVQYPNGKTTQLQVCCECHEHILKYPVNEMGIYAVTDEFKKYYIRISRLYLKKNNIILI